MSAYVQPIAHRYLDDLTARLADAGMTYTPYIMQSNCGVDTVRNARAVPITMIESGPASGVWGAAALGRLIDEPEAIAIDIGGTTAKCSLISGGQIKLNTNYIVEQTATSAGYPVMVPVVDLVEIGQGGGSIAWVGEFSRLHVGPQSAGADPGPVSYYDGHALESGMAFAGPAVIEEADTTVIIPPNMNCFVDSYGNYQITTTQD